MQSFLRTVPWSQRGENGAAAQTTSKGGDSLDSGGGKALSTFIKGVGYAQNPDSIISKAVTAIGKAFPIVAAAYAVVQLVDSAVTTNIQFNELKTGDYKWGVHYQNFKTGINIGLHPVSSTIQNLKNQQQWERENYRRAQERDLLGDSVINSYTNRGV